MERCLINLWWIRKIITFEIRGFKRILNIDPRYDAVYNYTDHGHYETAHWYVQTTHGFRSIRV